MLAHVAQGENAMTTVITDMSQLASKTDLLLLEQRMTIKLGGVIVVATGVILAAIRLLH